MTTLYQLHGYTDDAGNEYDLLVKAEDPREAAWIWSQATERPEPATVHAGDWPAIRQWGEQNHVDSVMYVSRVELPPDTGPAHYRTVGWFQPEIPR